MPKTDFKELALESVVETILLYGEYPQPSCDIRKRRHREFDLYDYLQEKIDPSEVLEHFILSITDQTHYGAFSNRVSHWEDKITKWLETDLADSDMVIELAEQYEDEAAEENCTCGQTAVNCTTIDPPERKTSPTCEVHGDEEHRDPAYKNYLERQ